jgi:hypothetical protein
MRAILIRAVSIPNDLGFRAIFEHGGISKLLFQNIKATFLSGTI